MRPVREWHDTVQVAAMGEDEVISWDGKTWKSLSGVPGAIMGARGSSGRLRAPAEAKRGMKNVHCAILTCKSSEDGLEQGFNSLGVHYKVRAASMLSQVDEELAASGRALPGRGMSGGKHDRPALQRVLADISPGRVAIMESTRSTG